MCYGMNCPYEIIGGPNWGDCSIPAGQPYPGDAVCNPYEELEEEDDSTTNRHQIEDRESN